MNRIHTIAFAVAAPGLALVLAGQAPNSGSQPTAPTGGAQQQQQSSAPQNPAAQPITPGSQDPRRFPSRSGDQVTGVPSDDSTRAPTTDNERDLHLAALLAALHQQEINLGQVGEERAADSAVRDFARAMVQEHTEFLNQVTALAQSLAGASQDGNEITSPFTDPRRSRQSAPNRRQNSPRRDRTRETNPPASPTTQPRGNQQGSLLNGSSAGDDLYAAGLAGEPTPVVLTSFQAQRQDRGEAKKAPAGSQPRSSAPLVTPGMTPERSAPNQENRQNRQSTRNNRTTDSSNTANNTDGNIPTNNVVVQALQEMSARRFEVIRGELGNLNGQAFDRAFMQVQISMHIELVAMQAAMQQLARTGELRQLVQDGLALDEEHLAEARRIASELQGTTDQRTTDQGTTDADSTAVDPSRSPFTSEPERSGNTTSPRKSQRP